MVRLLSLACVAIMACSPSQTDGGTTERAESVSPSPNDRPAALASPEPSRPAFEPATECVEPARPMVIMEVSGQEANPRDRREWNEPTRRRYQTYEGADLDGDGTAELFVPEVDEHACPHEVRYTIYVMRGDDCGHPVGTLLGGIPSRVEPSGAALDDLVVERDWTRLTDLERPPSAENVATRFHETTRYRFDGQRYVRGEPDVGSGICHHCALVHCRRLDSP